MRLFLRNWRWLAIALALAGGGAESLAQQRSAASVRHFTQHEVWGEALVDSQVEAELAARQLPSPEETTGVAWDQPGEAHRLGQLVSAEPSDDVPTAALPRLSLAGQEEAFSLDESWEPMDYRLPLMSPYRTNGLSSRQRWQAPQIGQGDESSRSRHIVPGEPLAGMSWPRRPWYAGAFFGGAFRDDVPGQMRQTDGALAGVRLGWDLDDYYGIEGRYAFSNPQIVDGAGNSLGDAQHHLADVSALYYPFGDARWRPYFGLGVGMSTYRFRDATGTRMHDTALSMPISVGLKYFYSPHFTLRLDAVDSAAFGSRDLEAMNQFSLLGSVEYRFGGRRTSDIP
jgi:hypothetical protein